MPVSAADFCEQVRRNPLAKSQAGLERLNLALGRLLSVLDREEVACIRTLEMKISDAGPLPQRVEPHILGLAGVELVTRNRVTIHHHPHTANHNWYAPSRFTRTQINPKLDALASLYLETTDPNFTTTLGDPLEISIFKILQQLKAVDRRFTHLGAFDLTQRLPSGRFPKTEPPINYSGAALIGPPDYVFFDPKSGESAMLECKNHREWIYPSHDEIKVLVSKALSAEMTPVLIARRLPYITKAALCEPAGIIAHETYHQLYPETEYGRNLAARVTQPRSLGYFDVKASEEPLLRTIDFFQRNLPNVLPVAAEKFRAHRAMLQQWVDGAVSWRRLRLHLAGQYDAPDREMDF